MGEAIIGGVEGLMDFRRMSRAEQQGLLLEKARDEAEDRAHSAKMIADKANKGIRSVVFGKVNADEKYTSVFTNALFVNMGMIGLKPSVDIGMLPTGYLNPEISTNELYGRDPSVPTTVPAETDFDTLFRNSEVFNEQGSVNV